MKATFGYTLFVVGIILIITPLPQWVGALLIIGGICLAVSARNEHEARVHRDIVDQIDAHLEQQRMSAPPQEESEQLRHIRQVQENLRRLNSQYLDDNGDDAA